MTLPIDKPVAEIHSRTELFERIPKRGVGAEIGVQQGHFSQDILNAANPQALYLIDCWEQQGVEATGSDPAQGGQAFHDSNYEFVRNRFQHNASVCVVKAYSVPAAADFDDESFDWIYIDANHLACYADMVAWWPKLKHGGLLMGHDYLVYGDFITVKTDVDRFAAERGLRVHATTEDCPNWVIHKPLVEDRKGEMAAN